MHIVCATHGYCFDGLASAVVFTRLASATLPSARFSYVACGYGNDQRRPKSELLSGDENAILDFRLSPLPQLDWYFDHHPTGIATADERAFFEARENSGRFFFNPGYSSCTKLIFDVAEEQGVPVSDLSPLMTWADHIDAARYSSAEEAISRDTPVMQLAAVVENAGDDELLTSLVPRLLTEPIEQVASDPEVLRPFKLLEAQHQQLIVTMRNKSEVQGRAVLCDLTDTSLESLGKFVPYALFPASQYSVVVAKIARSVKISVGHNPWSKRELDTDISAICSRWGGGGHAFVGGISFREDQLQRARDVARQIATELAEPG